MPKKRLIGVVTVKNSWAVQSFGYRRYLPLGKPEHIVENLDRWGIDEILIQSIDRSASELGPDIKLLEKISKLEIGTPIIYGGGIRTVEEGIQVIRCGADRITIDSLLYDNFDSVRSLAHSLGSQAIIASMPTSIDGNRLSWYNYRTMMETPFADVLAGLTEEGAVSEILTIDWRNEGYSNGFNNDIVKLFPSIRLPLIVFGGISSHTQINSLLDHDKVAAVAIGNFLNYRELSVQQLKEEASNRFLRAPFYNDIEGLSLADE